MKPTLTLLLLLLCRVLPAQTTISAGAQVSGTWTKASSPYYIKGNIAVPRDSTLVLEPGVQLRFDGKFQMAVYGKIKALGKVGDTIRFYPQDTLNRWRGIRYFGRNRQADSALFAYCRFEYAGPKQSNFETCLRMSQGHFKISNCVFTRNEGVVYSNSMFADSIISFEMRDCYFYKNRNFNTDPNITSVGVTGAAFFSKGTVINCIFESNLSRNPYNVLDEYDVNGRGSGATLAIGDYYSPNTTVQVLNCKFLRNTCALGGAGIGFGINGSSRLTIKDCEFTENTSGRYGCISSIGSNTDPKTYKRIQIEGCRFKGNIAANTTVGSGNAGITIQLFYTYDSVIIRNNLFENNTGRTVVRLGNPGNENQFLLSNVFRGNALSCFSAEARQIVWSVNNLYYNNLQGGVIADQSNGTNYYLRSINDAYLYNGPNIDTIALDNRLKGKYKGLLYNADGSCLVGYYGGGVFKNCIFWGNRGYTNNVRNLTLLSGDFKGIYNCIFEGGMDSIVWGDTLVTKPLPMVSNYIANLNLAPMFVKPPATFGPLGLDTSADFRLISSCSALSPAWNAGSNAAYSGLAGMLDKAGNARIACDTVDIGPYEIIAQFKRAHISRAPSDSTYCSNDLQLSASTTCNPKPLYTWQYKDGSNWSNISSGNSPVYKSNSPRSGLYRLVYSEQDCGHADTSRNISISLKPAPQPLLGNDTTIEQKASLTLNPGSYSSYRWQDGSAASTFSVNGIAAGIGKKAYHVTVSSANGCTGSDTIQVTVVWNSALEQLQQAGWKLYPNPALNLVHLESPDGAAFTWTLTDQSGRAIGSGSSTEFRAEIDVRTQPCGLYYLRIQSKNHSQTLTLQKM